MRLLIAETEPALGMLLSRALRADDYEITLVRDGEEAIRVLETTVPDLVILDLNLSKRDGTEVLAAVRRWRSDVPVVVLTSRADLDTRIACFELGADDFLAKPFSTRELRARCRALLRRAGQSQGTVHFAGVTLNRADRVVTRSGRPISLTNREFALLECLMASRGACVSRANLLEHVWPAQTNTNTNVLDVYVNYLRRKLDDGTGASLIQTVRGAGYRLSTPEQVPGSLLSGNEQQFLSGTSAWRPNGNSHGEQQFSYRVAG